MALDDLDRRLIRATQAGLPLVSRPYEAVGASLGIGGEEVRRRLQAMLDNGIVRRIGAVPNHYRLGFTANGMSVWDVADERVDELGERVGRLSGVSH
ncbi:MAG TPA: AsnC family transcriptional regulator, partial [Hydrogenophaga sp.]